MPGRPQRFHDLLAEAYSAVKQLDDSPLRCIAQGLNSALERASQAHSRGEIADEELGHVANYVLAIVRLFPRTYGDRFKFDAGLIQAMSNDWSDGQKLFSPMIVPCYEDQWKYARRSMPLSKVLSDSSEHLAHVIDLIFLPKGDDLGNVALLATSPLPGRHHPTVHSVARYLRPPYGLLGCRHLEGWNYNDSFLLGFWVPDCARAARRRLYQTKYSFQ